MTQVATGFSWREIVVPMTRRLSHPSVFQTFRTMVDRFIALRCAAGYAGIKSFRWNFYRIHPAVFQTFRTMVDRFIALRCAAGYAGIKSFHWNFHRIHAAVFQTFLTVAYRYIALRCTAGDAGIKSFRWTFHLIHPAVFQTFLTMVYRFIALRCTAGYAGIRSFLRNFQRRRIQIQTAMGIAMGISMGIVKGIVIVMATATRINLPSPKGVFRYQHSPQGYDCRAMTTPPMIFSGLKDRWIPRFLTNFTLSNPNPI
jgi:hypothetical protein